MKKTDELLGYLNGEKSYLINLSPENLYEKIIDLLDFLLNKRNWSCLYVCANKSSTSIRKKLIKEKFDLKKFYFIDAVQKKSEEKTSNVFFMSSPSELTKINTIITQLSQFNQGHGFVFIDSLDGFSLDNNEIVLARFIRSIVASTSKYNTKILLLVAGGVDEKLLNRIKPFFDKVVHVEKEGEIQD